MLKKSISSIRSVVRHQRELTRFRKRHQKWRDIVFYSEGAANHPYLMPFIEHLTNSFGRNICYITSDDDDPFLISPPFGVEAFSIGNGIARTLLFATLDANVMVMTLLDLNNSYIKKSFVSDVHYVFVPHNMISTHMVFGKGAHDHYDTIFCVGPHQVAELREAEKKFNLPRRNLIENGYVRLDTIFSQCTTDSAPDLDDDLLNIVIAPSWGADGLLENGAEDLVNQLLAEGFRVTIRPHWETIRRARDCINSLIDKFSEDKNFIIVTEGSTNELLSNAHLLISDWSGSAFSFAFGLERPVLFIDTPKKVNNPEYRDYKNKPVEITMRDQLGAVLTPGDYSNIGNIIWNLCADKLSYRNRIRQLRSTTVFNFGDSAALGAGVLDQLARSRES